MEVGFEKQEWEVDQETAPIDEFITVGLLNHLWWKERSNVP